MLDLPAPASNGGVDQRKTRRVKVFVPTELILNGIPARAHLLDLSASGARIHTHSAAKVGEHAVLRLNDEAHEARIIWSRGDRLGLKFKRELNANQIAQSFASHPL
ncbi:PilZ domain-containing protein [Sphingomonas aurea]|uniref:PilZ domain-containing protein n=1 Tax=Sphingomonas aurea TaxID=3063994 RepID=UPI00351D0ECA